MKEYYLINDEGIIKSDKTTSNLEIYRRPSITDKQNFIENYDLPKDIFHFDDMPEIAPRIEILKNKFLGKVSIFVISNIDIAKENLPVENRLESHTFLLTEKKLFWFMDKNVSTMDQNLFNAEDESIDSLESIIMTVGLLAYKNFVIELNKQKKKIDNFHNSAINSTSNVVLTRLADTERDMVLLQHTTETQELAFDKLLTNEKFIRQLNNDHLVYDIRWYNRQVKQLVIVYRDLLDATSSLFTDIMGNNLNQLMKSLTTISLILAAATFIPGLWGINTFQLPFRENKYRFLIVSFIALLAGLIMYLYLKKQDHFED